MSPAADPRAKTRGPRGTRYALVRADYCRDLINVREDVHGVPDLPRLRH